MDKSPLRMIWTARSTLPLRDGIAVRALSAMVSTASLNAIRAGDSGKGLPSRISCQLVSMTATIVKLLLSGGVELRRVIWFLAVPITRLAYVLKYTSATYILSRY